MVRMCGRSHAFDVSRMDGIPNTVESPDIRVIVLGDRYDHSLIEDNPPASVAILGITLRVSSRSMSHKSFTGVVQLLGRGALVVLRHVVRPCVMNILQCTIV